MNTKEFPAAATPETPEGEISSADLLPAAAESSVRPVTEEETRTLAAKIAASIDAKEKRDESHPAISQEEFARQFAREYTSDFEGQPVPYAKIEPPVLSSTPWVVFVGGFSTTKELYHNEILNLAEHGRRVLFVNPEVTIRREDKETDPVISKVPLVIRTEKDALRKILEDEGIRGSDMVAHSRGAAIVSTLLAEDPTFAKRALLDSPAGLIGRDSPIRLLARSILEAAENRMNILTGKEAPLEETEKIGQQALHRNLLKNLTWHLTQELPATANTDIRPLLKRIRSYADDPASSHVEMVLLNAHGDHIFKPRDIESALGDDPLSYFDRWVNYSDKDSSHGKVHNPDAGVYPVIFPEESAEAKQTLIKRILVDEH